MSNSRKRNLVLRRGQRGALTMFTAVLILILLTEMIIYAVHVGVFEQRKSANDMKQKLAFHTADSGVQQAKQFFTVNASRVSSSTITGGWLNAGSLRWQPCPDLSGQGTHPCYGEPVKAMRDGSYFYSFDGSNELPLDPDALTTSASETVAQHALLCMLEIDRDRALLDPPLPIVVGCTRDASKQDDRYFLVTLLARGEADCVGTNCGAEALIAQKIGSYGPGGGAGGPGVPLTARTNVPLSGTVEVVPNPNGGGLGVPISTWANARTSDPPGFEGCALADADPVDPISGSYSTCERHEFYGYDTMPSDYKCPSNKCACEKGEDRLLSYAQGNDRILGDDILPDPNFPCDLWLYTFGHDKYADPNPTREIARGIPGHYLTDCSSLDSTSSGIYWISGTRCSLQTQIGDTGNGTVGGPVLLISAASDTRVNAGAEVYGMLLVTDLEDPNAEFTGNGQGTIYGAAIMDAEMKNFNGTFQIVYVEELIERVLDTGAFGAVAGGWTDFHTAWQ
jgi:hypothetical protein